MREKARRATDEEENAVKLTMDGRLIHDGTGILSDFDQFEDNADKVEGVYRQFNAPGARSGDRSSF
ncbi:hypothetical protein PRIPAC_89621 [Pristionchus pacificus]|uniref:Uncharacterized protein n=1 Tax=Pristionchus pacificus TaxID=54126 RepID=A0A2A6CZ22_PRIPA|nr:hypothetical protein PRIPAC_89621 [Pristionchus pacificus]|eukprot:PDM83356.1 hypothetical protein PRIPAC_34988 [Pristionchus pacificus]